MRCQACQGLYDANQPGMDRARCPACVQQGRPVRTRQSSPVEPVAQVPTVEAAEEGDATMVECPECAEPIRARARSCRFCGYDLERGRRPVAQSAPSTRAHAPRSASLGAEHVVLHMPKSPGVAVILSFFWAGLGQLYAGAIGKGLAIMIAPTLALVLLVAPMFLAGESRPGLERGEPNTVAFGGIFLILVVAALCFWAWQLFDAYATANEANRRQYGGGRSLRKRRRR